MGAYIFRRLWLMIPTLIGIMLVNFTLVQFVPGGPIERIISQIENDSSSTDRITGASGEVQTSGESNIYNGSRGLPPDLIADLEKQFNLDKPAYQRFFIMMGDYFRFEFGESYFRSISVIDLITEKMPVSITLGVWSTLLAYLISIPLGIRKAVSDGSKFDTWSSGVIIAAYAVPSFLFAILLLVMFAGGSFYQWFPNRGLRSDDFATLSLYGQIKDYLWHIVLPVTASTIGAFATLTLLTKNSFLDEINKQYVITARAKGLKDSRVFYGHVFRNAMLIIIAGFPAAFIAVFFSSSLIIEIVFSLDGLGLLGFKAIVDRDYAVVFGTLYIFGLMGLIISLISDLMYVFVDPRIDFESRET